MLSYDLVRAMDHQFTSDYNIYSEDILAEYMLEPT